MKSLGLTPLSALESESATLLRLVTVMVFEALIDPILVAVNERVLGVKVIAVVPEPLRVTAWGLSVASSVMVTLAVLLLSAVATKVTVTAQFALTSSVDRKCWSG